MGKNWNSPLFHVKANCPLGKQLNKKQASAIGGGLFICGLCWPFQRVRARVFTFGVKLAVFLAISKR